MSKDTPPWHKKRLRAEKRFRAYGVGALGLAVLILVILLGSIGVRGYPGFWQTQIKLEIAFDSNAPAVSSSDYQGLMRASLASIFPDVAVRDDRKEMRELNELISGNAGGQMRRQMEGKEARSGAVELWLTASSNVDLFFKGKILETTDETDRKLSDRQISWLKKLEADGRVQRIFNTSFFTQGDSRQPEQAGFLGAMAGSALTLIVCLLASFPLGVATAVYLEEFARKNWWSEIVEVNINNLAAVPSIVFGLLGLAVYINLMGMPRSAPLVGGLTLALMILPVIIITTRVSLKAIPDSIRDAARALGASPVQVVWHHTLPLSMPGIMTGTILGLARAIGETAPLLMIGMVAFVVDTPTGFTSPATVMPVQVYLWAGSPEAGFAEKTAAGILALLVLLVAMNALAIYLRRRFEVRW